MVKASEGMNYAPKGKARSEEEIFSDPEVKLLAGAVKIK
jgi:hypothetical protein